MTDRINPQGGNNLDIRQAKAPATERSNQSEAAESEKRAEAAQDEVRLTNTATNLKRIEAKLADIPEIDSSKVSEIRSRLDSGSYEIDARQVAEKMLRLDQSFG